MTTVRYPTAFTQPADFYDQHTPLPCREVDPELFFPLPGASDVADKARAICRRCPVTAGCLEYAITTGQIYGIWGALSPEERTALKGRRRLGVVTG